DARTFMFLAHLLFFARNSTAPRIERWHLDADAVTRDHPEKPKPRGRRHVSHDPVAGLELDTVERVGHRLHHSSDDNFRHQQMPMAVSPGFRRTNEQLITRSPVLTLSLTGEPAEPSS